MRVLGAAIVFLVVRVFADDSQCTINGRKALHTVDEKFLSISVDPSLFFSGIKLSSASVNLARHFLPSYIRIAGPSTEFLHFDEDDSKSTALLTESSERLVFGPSMWWSLNQWIYKTNFTPVFAINDADKIDGIWDPEKILSLFDFTAKLNVDCYWQLGYDTSAKTEKKYKQDLTTLKHVLDAFPVKKTSWKVVGSDLSGWMPSEKVDSFREHLKDLEEVDAIMWEPERNANERLEDDPMHKFLTLYKPLTSIWTSSPKVNRPVDFASAINWAVEIGETARDGFDVVFRQPRLQELYTDTPVFWLSLLHKRLMGRNVLDVKTLSFGSYDAHVFAHCSKNQNDYSIRGAMTVMIVNNGTEEHRTAMRVAGTQMKNVDVRTYILSAPNETSLVTYLNDEKLSAANLTGTTLTLTPKLRVGKATTHLTLSVPAKSIGFFVLPGARIPVCVSNEDETNLVLDESFEEPKLTRPPKKGQNLFSRINSRKPVGGLPGLYRTIEKEIEQDEQFYKRFKMKPFLKKDEWKKNLLEKVKDPKPKETKDEPKLKSFLSKAKDIKLPDFMNLLKKDEESESEKEEKKLNIDLSSAEILKVLTDRAKAKVEKRVGLANSELDDFLERTFKNKLRTKRSARGGGHRGRGSSRKVQTAKRRPKRDTILKRKFLNLRLGDDDELKPKRDINMALLKEKVEEAKKSIKKHRHSHKKDEAAPKEADSPKHESLFERLNLPAPKFTLPTLPPFGLFNHKTTAAPTTAKPQFDDFMKGSDHDLFDDDLDELDDAVAAYNDFQDLFGDDVEVVKSKDKGRDPWGYGFGDETNAFESEFVINKQDNDVDRTIKQLEDFFNRSPGVLKLPDFGRYKRDLRESAAALRQRLQERIDSIKNAIQSRRESVSPDFSRYVLRRDRRALGKHIRAKLAEIRKALKSRKPQRNRRDLQKHIDELKASIRSAGFGRDALDLRKRLQERVAGLREALHSKLRRDRRGLNYGDFRKRFQERMDNLRKRHVFKVDFSKLRSEIGRLRERNNIPSDDKLMYRPQIAFLKSRLAHRKRMDDFDKWRRERSVDFDEVYVPKVNFTEPLLGKYLPQLGKDEWKAEDIMKLPKQTTSLNVLHAKGRRRRYIISADVFNPALGNDIFKENSIENEIIDTKPYKHYSDLSNEVYTNVLSSIRPISVEENKDLNGHTEKSTTEKEIQTQTVLVEAESSGISSEEDDLEGIMQTDKTNDGFSLLVVLMKNFFGQVYRKFSEMFF